jgi:sugar/nucleoside kinase (ribokinase family)
MTETYSMPDICCIGHITHDKVITPKFEAHMPGGTAYYFAKALARFDHSTFQLITAVGDDNNAVIDELRADGLNVTVLPSRHSVFFENKYAENMADRTQRVLAKADPFTTGNLVGAKARIFHLGTLLADDFSFEVIRHLSVIGIVSVDIQGYLRKVIGDKVYPVDYDLKREAMPYIHILKANEMEMEVLTGISDPYDAARKLADWGCREVLLTLGDKGSLIYADGNFYEIPAITAKEVVDTTGCGDTYMAGYLYMRARGASYQDSGTFAAAMCTLKLERKGPFDGTQADVEALIGSQI